MPENQIVEPLDSTLETVISIAYDVAPSIYRTKRWDNTLYTLDEFRQDAAIYIYEKYEQGYFEGKTEEQLRPMVYGMISGWFLRNTLQVTSKYRARYIPANESDTDEETPHSIRTALSTSNIPTPSEELDAEVDTALGREVADKLVQSLSPIPYKTRKHKYALKIDDEEVLANDQLIAELLLAGLDYKDIAQILSPPLPNQHKYYSHNAASSYIGTKAHEVFQKLMKRADTLTPEEKRMLMRYFKSTLNNGVNKYLGRKKNQIDPSEIEYPEVAVEDEQVRFGWSKTDINNLRDKIKQGWVIEKLGSDYIMYPRPPKDREEYQEYLKERQGYVIDKETARKLGFKDPDEDYEGYQIGKTNY